MFRTILIGIFLGTSTVYAGGAEVGNGGDAIAQEFKAIGQETIKYIPLLTTSVLDAQGIQSLRRAIEGAKVETKESLFLDSAEVDAINYPASQKIEVSRSRWLAPTRDSRDAHWRLSVHEYLWLAGFDDTGYRLSNPLFDDLLAARGRWVKSPISEALTQALCGGIISRDLNTIEQALSQGADGSIQCKATAYSYNCTSGQSGDLILYEPITPLELAMDFMGRDQCDGSHSDPAQDQDMLKIFKLILAYHPDLTGTSFGAFRNDSLLSTAARKELYDPYVALLSAGANPNQLSDFGGLLHWYPIMGVRFFEAAMMAGADINLPYPEDPRILHSAYILAIGSEEVVKLLVSNYKINFCLSSVAPNSPYSGPPVPVLNYARPEDLPYIRSFGGPCVK